MVGRFHAFVDVHRSGLHVDPRLHEQLRDQRFGHATWCVSDHHRQYWVSLYATIYDLGSLEMRPLRWPNLGGTALLARPPPSMLHTHVPLESHVVAVLDLGLAQRH